MTNPTLHTQIADDEIDLGRLVNILWQGKKLILALGFGAAFIGIIIALLSTPVYQSNALLQIQAKDSGSSALLASLGGAASMLGISGGGSSLNTETEVINSRTILLPAIEQAGLDIQVSEERGLFHQLFNPNYVSALKVRRLELPVNLLDTPLSLKVTGQNYQLHNEQGDTLISGQLNQPQQQDNLLVDISAASDASGTYTIVKQSPLLALKNLRQQLKIEEQGQGSGIINLSLQGPNPLLLKHQLATVIDEYLLYNIQRRAEDLGDRLSNMQGQLPEIKQRLEKAENELNAYRIKNSSVDVGIETESVLRQSLEIEQQLNELAFKEAEMSRLYTSQHPNYQALQRKKQALIDERNKLGNNIKQLPDTQQDILRLTRNVQISQQLYVQMLTKVEELNVFKAGEVSSVRLLDAPALMPDKVKPKRALIVVLAGLLGGMLSVGIVLVRGLLTQKIEAELLTEQGVTVLAELPASNNADYPYQLRELRSRLQPLLQAGNHLLAINNPTNNPSLASDLAQTLASANVKVLLIDGNMSTGTIHQQFALSASPGLSDVLQENASPESAIQHTKTGLDVLTAGKAIKFGSDLLLTEHAKQTLTNLGKAYNAVIIITPPSHSTEAKMLAALADVAILSVSSKDKLKQALAEQQSYQQHQVKLNGMVISS